ncbi:MAG: DUF4258 domain-containing protein [Alphaproteobacteria bacterium]|nr:DUF4258 domain-containing protein [Alphaproteobacteria bacterium]
MLPLLLACALSSEPSPATAPERGPATANAPATSPEPAPATAPEPAPATSPDLRAQLAARPLVLTRHGECRMACRHIDRSEVVHLLATGDLVPERSRTDGECPSHAIEGRTPDGQTARLVVAACPDETRVVTVIDLDTDWECACD